MTEHSGYSVSYGITPPGPSTAGSGQNGTSAPGPLVAFASCDLIPVNAQMMLVINRENGRQKLIVPGVVEALKTCTRFDTVSGHARSICRNQPQLAGQEAGVEQTLEQLRSEGFLLEAQTISDRLNREGGTQRAATRVFIITCDRPQELARLLESMLTAGGLTEHDGLYLIDDSRDPQNREQNREAVGSFSTRSAKSMLYFGDSEQAELLSGLIDNCPQHEEGIRFLIDRERWQGQPTYGRARNLALLLSVGFRAIMLDDDILCQAVRPAVPEEGIAVGIDHGREASFFASRDDLMGLAAPVGESPLTLHARYLGASLGDAVRGLNGGDLNAHQLADSNAAMTNVWRADSPILVTQCGAWGDPGTGDAHWTLRLSDYSISRLLAAPQGVTQAIENRCVWLGAPRPAIIKMANMSQLTGVDNSALLPPYFPAFRGEDLLFASMVEAMHPRAAVLEHAFAVPHLPAGRPRKSLRDPIAGAGSVALFSAYLTNRIDYTDANTAGDRLAMLAQDFRRLAEKRSEDLVLDYRREVAAAHALALFQLTEQHRRTRDMNSANWSGYLERGIGEMNEALQREWSPLDIEGVPAGLSSADIVEGFRGFLRGYAKALDGWPSLRDAALRLAP